MSDKDWLAEARALCDAATPGPWVREDDWMCEVNAELRELGVDHVSYENVVKLTTQHERICFNGASDADFIATARTALPRALTALEAADALVASYAKSPAGAYFHTGEEAVAFSAALAAYRKVRE